MALAVYGPTPFVITTADRVAHEGDSTHSLDGDAQGFALVGQRLFALARKSPTGPKPLWINQAVSSTGMNTQLGRIQTALAQYQPLTKFLWGPGIFDIIGSAHVIGTVNDTSALTWLGGFNLITQLVAGYSQIPMLIIGPGYIGEKWPTGQNSVAAHDADIDALDAGMITIVQRSNAAGTNAPITYVSQRQSVYATYEPLLNLPAPGVESGPLTAPDSQKCHDNPAGRYYRDQAIQQVTQLVAATTYNPSPAVYSGLTPPSPGSIGNDYDPANLALTDGANVTAWPNSLTAKFGTAADLTVTPATKPVYHTPGDGTKLGGAPTVTFGGAAFIRSGAFGAGKGAQPFITAMLIKPANLTATQIWLDGLVDGAAGSQEPYVATIITSGNIQLNAGTAQTTAVGIAPAAIWHLLIIFWSGHGNNNGDGFTSINGDSYVVTDGRVNAFMNPGLVGITGRTIGANASGSGFANGQVARITEWYSSLGPLPRWQDILGWMSAKYGVVPQ